MTLRDDRQNIGATFFLKLGPSPPFLSSVTARKPAAMN
jgi:hypothetical protein